VFEMKTPPKKLPNQKHCTQPKPSSAAAIPDINFYIYHHHAPFRPRSRNANNENHESCTPDTYFEPRLHGSSVWYCVCFHFRFIDLSSRVTKISSAIAAMVRWFWECTRIVTCAVIRNVAGAQSSLKNS